MHSGRLASLLKLHNSLRSEMWTWQLADSLLRDTVESELSTGDDDSIQEDSHTVSLLKQLFSLLINFLFLVVHIHCVALSQ